MSTTKFAASLLVLLALILNAGQAHAETVNCTPITSLPKVITVQGVYCFTGDLSTSMAVGNAIDIQANNVTVDLNGFKLGGIAAGLGTTAIGFHAANRQNITIKNGTVRGFLRGIYFENFGGSQGHVIEDIRADQNTVSGIFIDGNGTIVRNNQVVATGGTTTDVNANIFGIVVFGQGPRVLNNDVISTLAQGTGAGYGIYLAFGTSGGNGSVAVNNRISVANKGIEYGPGASGKFRDNVTSDVTTPFTGGTNIGNNN